MKKRISALALLFLLTVSAVFQASAAAITDISGNWAEKEIQYFVDQGYIVGYGDGTFLPDKTVTRAEFVRIVNNAFKFNSPASITFKDVNLGDWYYDDVRYAVAAGFISGYADNTFRPNNNITREEVASIIQRIIQAPSNTSYAPSVFSDVPSGYFYNGAIGALTSAKIMKGTTSTTFGPKTYETRADTAYSLYNALFNGTAENTVVDGNVIVRKNSYGPSSEFDKETVPKNLYVKSENDQTTIKNVIVQGDLVIENTAKRLYLDNVSIKGKLVVNGGSYLSLSKTDVQNMEVNNIRERIRVNVSKDSICYNSDIYTSCYLAEDLEALSLGFSNVVIDSNSNSAVTVDLSGNFITVDIYAQRTVVNLNSGYINDLYFYNTAENSSVNLSSNTKVENAEVNASYVSISGAGLLSKAKIEAANVTLSTVPQTLTGSYSPKYSSDVENNNLIVTVINDSGAPIDNAAIKVYGITKTTDSKGEAVFVNIPMGTHEYLVERTGFDSVSGTIDVFSYNTKRTVTLSSANTYTLSLTVLNNSSGEAISGASVKLDNVSTLYTYSGGVVSFSGLKTGVYTYTVSASGYSSVTDTVSINNSSNSKTIRLVPTAPTTYAVEFFVYNSVTNAPIKDASVTVGSKASVTTNVNGIAQVSGLTSGSQVYSVTASGYGGEYNKNVSVPATNKVNVYLTGLHTLEIKVTDDTGANIIGAQLLLSDGRTTTTNTNGIASFAGLIPGSYAVTVSHSGYSVVTRSADVNSAGTQGTLTVSLTPTAP